MKFIKNILLFVLVTVFSFGTVSAAGWSAGPGLAPSDDFKSYRTIERRLGISTARIPHDKEVFSAGARSAFNAAMDNAAAQYLQNLNKEGTRRLSGWMIWQAGAAEPYASVVLLQTTSYEGGAHPLNYVKGFTFDKTGKELTLTDLQAAMPSLTVEALRQEAIRECMKRNISTELAEQIMEFPKEFYIGNDGHLYFIFQQYDIAPYSEGWIMADMGVFPL